MEVRKVTQRMLLTRHLEELLRIDSSGAIEEWSEMHVTPPGSRMMLGGLGYNV